MKTKLILSLVLIIPVIVFYFSKPNAEEINTGDINTFSSQDSFLIGSTANGSYQDYAGYRKANMNLWHIYEGGSDVIGGKWYPAGWLNIGAPNDRLFSDSSQYIGDVQTILKRNADSGLTSNMMRPKIEYLSYGQHSDYQCDSLPEDQVNNATDWFYSYRVHETGRDVNDNQPTPVRLCEVNNPGHQAGYVVRSLKANRELCNEDDLRVNTDHIYDWYFMPQIKIPQGLNNNTQVCRIDVVSWDSVVLKSWELTAGSFLDSNLSYSGGYIQEFNLRNLGYEPMTIKVNENLLFNPYKHGWTDVNANCKFDIRVYWYKQCNMWIDYIRVENDVAYDLLSLNPQNQNHARDINWIRLEAQQVGGYAAGAPHKFYIEEVEYNSFKCIKYVDSVIRSYTPNMSLVCVPYLAAPPMNGGVWYNFNKEKIKSVYQYLGMTEFYMSYYPLHGDGNSMNYYGVHSYIPNTFPNCVYNNCEYDLRYGNLGVRVPINTYEKNLQDLLDNHGLFIDNGLKTADYISKELQIPFIFMEQAHLWLNNSLPGNEQYSQREPTNEELEVMADIALTYGARGISYFAYDSWGYVNCTPNDSGYYSYGRGLMENNKPDTSKRYTNVYGQNKWQKIVDLDAKLKRWGPYLVSFDVDYSHSYIYHNRTERNDFLSQSYFNDIVTYKPSSTSPDCTEDGPGVPNPPNLVFDCKNDRYLQVATFKTNPTDVNKYFMIVNRRCSPFLNENSENESGGRRFIKIGFDVDSTKFGYSYNWQITDLDSNKLVATFDTRSSALVTLGWFNPGEGKLYKLTPVAFSGGTLAADETLSGNINCNGKIYNNGYNITINQGTSVTFTDSAGIEMNGGTFTCGVNADNADAVTLQKTSAGTGWCGLTLNNCSSVGIYNTTINGVKANDTSKSVSMTNCYNANFRRNTFSQTNNSGAIQVVYTNPSDETLILNIRECNFNMGPSGYSGVNIISNASMTTPVIVEWCMFNTSNDTSNAVMLTNVTGGAIKNNSITGFKKSIVALTSAIDIYGNRIVGCNSSYGIQCLSGSDVTMKIVSGYHLGGENYIRNYGSSSACIYSDNSLFDINYGENHFDLDDIDNSKFLTGTLSGTPADNVDATKNCFHKDSVQNIEGNHSMTWYSSNDPVGFTFAPYNCELSQNEDFIVFNYGGYNDTVYYNPGGQGSGFNPDKLMNIQEGNYKSLRDTINLNLRKRNYSVVEDKAKQLLTQYPDSLESVGMVQKLYIASFTLDQNGNKIGQLKTYLENLISSNSQNPALIKRAFYHIQKCKVKLGQYQSALDGFQYIMTQNPYSYEGLVASWDYAATYLLMGQGGSISGETEQMTEELSTPADTLLNRMSRNDSKTKTITDGQKTKIFYEKVKIATKDDKTVQEEKIKQLEKTIESSKSDVTKSKAQTELTTMKTIKESVKIKKPNSVKTHVIMINNDIKKIFGIGKGSKTSNPNNLLPNTYELYQNYPNPFNPSTKIAFDLPQDGKVKLVIYDILGRQIKTLVDNELRTAGKYTIEFNGSNLASGVYFYRLQVSGGKEYMAVKKMLMIK